MQTDDADRKRYKAMLQPSTSRIPMHPRTRKKWEEGVGQINTQLQTEGRNNWFINY